MKYFIAIILLIVSTIGQSKTSYSQKRIEDRVGSIIQHLDPNINIGIVVHSKKNNQIIYNLNGKRAYVPASTLKILTAIASLIDLGENYRFTTSVHFDANKIKQHRLYSDLYFKFSGDPELTKKDLKHLITKLKKKGIQSVRGDIYIDASRFSGKAFGPGWMWDDQQSCYSAPLSAVILNRNCAAFSIQTYKNRDEAEIKNNMDLNITGLLTRLNDADCLHELNVNKQNDYHFSGCILPGKHVLEIAINYPEYYASTYLKSLFKEENIQFSSMITIKKTPQSMKTQITHRSPPLIELVKKMLKDSDNLIAGSLLKTLGANYFNEAGTWRNGVKAIKRIVKRKLNVNLKNSQIVDGAGLSRYNLIRPSQLATILAKMRVYPKQLRLLKKSLPIAGKDGTLKYRFKKHKIGLYAKTGTMNGVTSLAGYIETQHKDLLSFAIMINGIVGKTTRYKKLEEKLCRYFASL